MHAQADNTVADQEVDALRAGTWSLLGNLLSQAPDAEMLGLLRGIGSDPVAEADDHMAQAWVALKAAAEATEPEAVAREYQDVFIGLGSGEVIPYASYYHAGSLMERPLIELRRELASLGVERREGVTEPEDHGAAVCETMAFVITDPDVSYDWQKQFHAEHVAPWMGDLFRDVQQAPSAVFYRAVGQLGERFMEFEQRYFSMA